jgi:hypothetical protein
MEYIKEKMQYIWEKREEFKNGGGLGVKSMSEMELLQDMSQDYNNERTNRDYWKIICMFISNKKFDYTINYKTTYDAEITNIPKEYKESGGHFPVVKITPLDILSAPAQEVRGTTRTGGFQPTSGKKLTKSTVEGIRDM